MEKKLVFPICILLGCIILGSFFYVSQANNQKSIEKQQQIALQAKTEADQVITTAKAEQDKKDYIVKRKEDCYNISISEGKKHPNVTMDYDENTDICTIWYDTHQFDNVDCATYCGTTTNRINSTNNKQEQDSFYNCTINNQVYSECWLKSIREDF